MNFSIPPWNSLEQKISADFWCFNAVFVCIIVDSIFRGWSCKPSTLLYLVWSVNSSPLLLQVVSFSNSIFTTPETQKKLRFRSYRRCQQWQGAVNFNSLASGVPAIWNTSFRSKKTRAAMGQMKLLYATQKVPKTQHFLICTRVLYACTLANSTQKKLIYVRI